MKDKYGSELKIGDEVVFMARYLENITINKGVITSFDDNLVNINYFKMLTTKRRSSAVIKVGNND